MKDPFGNHETGLWIPFLDLVAGILSIFLVVAILLTFHLTESKKKEADIASPGSLMVEIFWKEEVDVDLWVRSPGDEAVGYSRKNGTYMDLLRDDLGFPWEKTGDRHHENAFSRKIPAGEYVVNVHMYSNTRDPHFPIEVEVAVLLQKESGKSEVKKFIKTTVNLNQLNQEITVARFRLDQEGDLIPSSVNHDQMPLRQAH